MFELPLLPSFKETSTTSILDVQALEAQGVGGLLKIRASYDELVENVDEAHGEIVSD